MIHDRNHYANESLSSGGVMPNPNETPQLVSTLRHADPHLGALAIVYTVLLNAALFFFGAVQHAGVAIGSFHEPRIIPAAIVETLCGLSLLWGATALFRDSRVRWRVALITNF